MFQGLMAPVGLILGASPLVIPLAITFLVAVFGIVTLIARGMGYE